jgi:hypothetical protein
MKAEILSWSTNAGCVWLSFSGSLYNALRQMRSDKGATKNCAEKNSVPRKSCGKARFARPTRASN